MAHTVSNHFAATYVEEIAAAERSGSAAVLRAKLAALSNGERRALQDALDQLQPA